MGSVQPARGARSADLPPGRVDRPGASFSSSSRSRSRSLLVPWLLFAAGCSAEWYQRSADEEASAILRKERRELFGVDRDFDVRQQPLALESLARDGTTEDLKRTPAPEPVRSPVLAPAPEQASPEGASPGGVPDPLPEGGASPEPGPSSEPGASSEPGPAAGAPGAKDPRPAEPRPAEPSDEPRNPGEPEAESPPAESSPSESSPADSPPASGPTSGGPDDAAPGLAAAPATGDPPAAAPSGGGPASGAAADLDPQLGADLTAEKEGAAPRIPARVLGLDAAIRLAFANNRTYQTQRESVYTTALSLTLARHSFAPRFFGAIAGDITADEDDVGGGLDSRGGFNLALTNGARVSINVVNSLFQYFTGDRRELANTILQGTLTQPLLRGFGTAIAREPLTQAERNVVYQIRSWERIRKNLAVQVISEYYRVLQARDRVTNEYNNWQSLVTSRDRVEALADAERVPRYQIDQARQQEFQAQNSWIDAVANYEALIDRFKITLAVPTDAPLALDQSELAALSTESVARLPVSVETAVEIALAERLDLRTTRDRVEDAERQVVISKDALRAQLDLVATATARSGREGSGAQLPVAFETEGATYGVGFDLDLPLDRKAERNAYVRSLLSLDQSRRDLSLEMDNIRLTVRDSYRRLEREIASYEIQKDSVLLAEQRVESTSALLQAGRAQTRDLLESQSALLSARNSLTAALISYAIARQDFLVEIEALRVDEAGGISSIPLGGMENHG